MSYNNVDTVWATKESSLKIFFYLDNPLAPVAPLPLHAFRTFSSEGGAPAIFLSEVKKDLQKNISGKM